MAERPVFLPQPDRPELVGVRSFSFDWNPGFAVSQKQKNIAALHKVASWAGCSPLLEISTKSTVELGRQLSAFNLKVSTKDAGDVFLECVFQGGKVFERGGPYTDLYRAEPRDAKRDSRLQQSGRLVGFNFENQRFPLEPKTAFYDWLYISAIYPRRESLLELNQYAGFTDIEFNPERSLNCQASACALFVALAKGGRLDEAMVSVDSFLDLVDR